MIHASATWLMGSDAKTYCGKTEDEVPDWLNNICCAWDRKVFNTTGVKLLRPYVKASEVTCPVCAAGMDGTIQENERGNYKDEDLHPIP